TRTQHRVAGGKRLVQGVARLLQSSLAAMEETERAQCSGQSRPPGTGRRPEDANGLVEVPPGLVQPAGVVEHQAQAGMALADVRVVGSQLAPACVERAFEKRDG